MAMVEVHEEKFSSVFPCLAGHIITDPHYRNRGLGEQLLLHMLRWGKENGATNSYLVVVANNAPAQKLYAKLGFQEQYQHWYRVKEKTKKTY